MRDGIRALFKVNDDIDIVGEACNGEEALQKAQELVPDVVVMDIAMPGIDGLEPTREIRNQNSQMKILILTQYNTKGYEVVAFQAGASGYLPKRALGKDLLSAIRIVHRGELYLYSPTAPALVDDYPHNTQSAHILVRRKRHGLRDL
jgi:DNA-binding NarL/FixJ family response regulator